ncbi:MAG TPA: tripartite tricarboxylate transporter substrate binding protein [Burkholderiales bacterium]|nr:tripartite tricarboxylate transporter substrate binding protein [Burkholderiales bacterium]
MVHLKCALRLCAVAALTVLAAAAGAADAFPSRPIRMLVPYGVGGNADIMARIVCQQLTRNLGQQVLVDNRPGANGIIGGELVAKAAPDGYTLLFIANSFATNGVLSKKLPYDILRDFVPVSRVGSTPLIIVVSPSLPASTTEELISLARAKPGELNYGSSGNGSPANLAGALLEHMARIKLVHVPYKGTAQATGDLLSGQVQIGFPSMTSVMPHVRAGRAKAIAITSLQRSALAPDIPTVAETGVPGYEASIWNGILAPAGVPAPLVQRLNAEIQRALAAPEPRERFVSLGADIGGSTAPEFRAYIETEINKWARVLRDAGIQLDLAR